MGAQWDSMYATSGSARRVLTGNAVKRMKSFADDAIAKRQAAGPRDVPDLLDLLLAGEDPETQRSMRSAELRDNLLTFIVAGHETTALTLAWALYLCAYDPDVQEAAAAQAREVLGDRPATADDVANLPLIRAIVDEALRLYPPAGLISRTALEADELCGREIKPGDSVMIPIYALHRNQLLWADPDRFDPGRFADGVPVDRYAYLPFGDGPRICIGAGFAVEGHEQKPPGIERRHDSGRDAEPVRINAEPGMGGESGFQDHVLGIEPGEGPNSRQCQAKGNPRQTQPTRAGNPHIRQECQSDAG